MDKITVAELATECSVKNQVVLSELKRLGLYVMSPTATIDVNFAETIRKKILAQREAEEAKIVEAERKKEAQIEAANKAAKKAATKKVEVSPVVEAPPAPVAGKAKKAAKKVEKVVEIKKEEEIVAKPSLKPRKGRKHYDPGTAGLVDTLPAPAPEVILPTLTPVEAAEAFFGDLGAKVEAPAIEPPTPPESPLEQTK